MRFFIPYLFLFLAACASPSEEPSQLPAWQLPEEPREVVQFLNGHYKDQVFQLQVRMSLTEESLQLVGLDTLGRRAFKIIWNEEGVSTLKAEWVSEKLRADDILNVIITAFWPEKSPVRQQVAERTGNLEIIYQSLREKAWNETVKIRDPSLGYEMMITSYEIAE